MGAVIVTVYIERGRCYPYTSKRIRLIVISGSDESKKKSVYRKIRQFAQMIHEFCLAKIKNKNVL